jgi:LuxR family maltose regulon positive regulatory protein
MALADTDTQQSGYLSLAVKNAYLFAGRALYERNDLAAAEQAIRKSIELCEQGTMEEAGFVYLLLARVLQATGDVGAALDEMRKAHEIDQHVPVWIAGFEAAWEALLYLHQGNLDAAARWAQESGLRFDNEVSLRTYVKHIVLARVLVAQGRSELAHTGSDRRLQEATVLLNRLVALTEPAGRMKYEIETRAVQALALYARRDREQALHTLERALTLAEPEGFVRTFVDEGAPMGELLKEAAARGIAPPYVARLLAVLDRETGSTQEKASPPSTVRPQSLVEPLSERELEVLSLLRTSLSLPEIADRLIVSANTVRSHAKHIYAKLGVHDRTAAVERAEELDLL